MNVIECFLYGTFPEEIVSDNIVDYVEQKYSSKETFKVKQVLEGTNPSKVLEGTIAYYSGYLMPYLSEPQNSKSLIYVDIDNKRLIGDFFGYNFEEQRDSYVYNSNPTNTYVRGSFFDILTEFVDSNYALAVNRKHQELLSTTQNKFVELDFEIVNSLDDFLSQS